MRKALVASLVVGFVSIAVWWWADRLEHAPITEPTPARSMPSVAGAPEGRPPRACAGHRPRTVDFNGDGQPDWVYLDWVDVEVSGHAVFGWCMEGRHGSFATSGMAETLSVVDLYGDGRHEVLFGGNTCCGQILKLAAYSRGRVRVVARPDGEALVLLNGLSPKNDRERWAVYGCDAEEGALTQVVAEPRGDVLRVRRTLYEIAGATAKVIDRQAGTTPDPGRRFRGRDVSETVAACIEVFEPKVEP